MMPPEPVPLVMKTAAPVALAPLQVSVIGLTGPIPPGPVTIATPDPHQPNLVVTVIGPVLAIVIRFANTFLLQFSGLIAAGLTPVGGKLLYTSDFLHLALVCASLSLPGAGVGLIKDLVTVFGKLEGKYPLLTGSI
jgi:hypothetical protein